MHIVIKLAVGFFAASAVSVGGVFLWQKHKGTSSGEGESELRQETNRDGAAK